MRLALILDVLREHCLWVWIGTNEHDEMLNLQYALPPTRLYFILL